MKTIKSILERFEERDFKIYDTYNDDFKSINDYLLSDEIKQFIQSSLTSLLDSIKNDIEKTKEEVKKQTGSYKYDDQYDDCINIINSHK